uniref:Uncharacterized protein n=1 Tax=Vespula pensylvanica TaxID=30213 RepID=A0A834PEB0_VESPE|nr:hypothetical protein H0235_004135 [Vespula pensylvanica]
MGDLSQEQILIGMFSFQNGPDDRRRILDEGTGPKILRRPLYVLSTASLHHSHHPRGGDHDRSEREYGYSRFGMPKEKNWLWDWNLDAPGRRKEKRRLRRPEER